MAKRGPKPKMERQRAASLVTGVFRKPAEPPAELTNEQKTIWREIVRGMPADWFNLENYPLLVQYCRHVSRAYFISQMIDDMTSKQFIIKDYRDLLRSEDEQSKIISSLATKMRLTQQSAYDKSKIKNRTSALDDPSAIWNFGLTLEQISQREGTPLEALQKRYGTENRPKEEPTSYEAVKEGA